MADMEVAIASGEDKIMTATSSNQDLQVSISFGKFENDSLSWEKFSSFSPNKYLEEVEKCATPGSVAQKKAYFESHYKKIAERNAEIILEQEKQLERNASFRPTLQNRGNTDSENDGSFMIDSSACCGSDGESTSEEHKLVTGIATEVNAPCNHEPLEETMYFRECQSSVDAGEDLNTLKLEKLEEIVCMEEEVKEDISSKDTGEMKETKKEKDQNLIKKTDKNGRTNHSRSSPKPNQVTKKPVASKIVTSRKTQPSNEKNMIKAASPPSKVPGFSTPRISKPASRISSMSTSRSSAKKETVSTIPRKKQTAPKPMQISLNLGQPSSDPTPLATTRKSLFMEQMGDKDIVRRAFKTFQKSFDQMKLSDDGQDTAPKQAWKSDNAEKNGANSHRSSSFVQESNGTAEKHEISKPGPRAVERICLPAKLKAEIINAKTRRQSLHPKAKSMQGGAPPKGSSDRVL